MAVYTMTRGMIAEAFGLCGESPDGEESTLTSLHIRLDNIWREMTLAMNDVIILPEQELYKLVARRAEWKKAAVILQQVLPPQPNKQESAEVLADLFNQLLPNLLQQVVNRGGVQLCTTPLVQSEIIRKRLCLTLVVKAVGITAAEPLKGWLQDKPSPRRRKTTPVAKPSRKP